jgi:hypothetical protein
MNIFWLCVNVVIAAKYFTDQHLIKIILEITQMGYAALWHNNNQDESFKSGAPLTKSGNVGYKITHKNHPMTKWVAETGHNFLKAIEFGKALCARKKLVYKDKGDHACFEHLIWLENQIHKFDKLKSTKNKSTPPPLCVGNDCYRDIDHVNNPKISKILSVSNDVPNYVKLYRLYYVVNKLHFNNMVIKYSKNPQPEWVKTALKSVDELITPDILKHENFEKEKKEKKILRNQSRKRKRSTTTKKTSTIKKKLKSK